MRRILTIGAALLCAVSLLPSGAGASAGSPPQLQATGTVTALGDGWLTLQTGGRRTGVINALLAAANSVAAGNYPYVWGGGHAQAGVASVGIAGPGHNGRRVGFDCSGSVAAVLAGAGLWPPGGGVPADNGVIAQLLRRHIIARGAGAPPAAVNLYDDPGVHIFMSINGRFFGTSDGGGPGSRRGGPGWLFDGAPDASNPAFRRYHILPSVLRDRTTYGHSLTFSLADPSQLGGVQLGDRLSVLYASTSTGRLIARSLTYVGAITVQGSVVAVDLDQGTLTVQPPSGPALTLTASDPQALDGLAAGDVVTVSYTSSASGLTLRGVSPGAPPQ